MPALLTSSGRPGFYFRVLQEGDVGAGDEIVKVAEAKERMTVAEINALLYSPDHRARSAGACIADRSAVARMARLVRGVAAEPDDRGAASGNAGLMPAAAAHPVAAGFRPLTVTAIDRECEDVLSLTMQDPDGQPLRAALPGQYVVLRLRPDRRRPATLSQLLAFGSLVDGALSNQREDRAEWRGRNLPPQSMSGWAMFSTSACRAAASCCNPESGRSCCSAQESARRRFWRCCTRWRRRGRRGRSCGCYQARDRQHHPFAAEVRRLMLALTHGRSYVCYSRPGPRRQGRPRTSTAPATCRDPCSTRSASHATPMSTCAGRLASWQT